MAKKSFSKSVTLVDMEPGNTSDRLVTEVTRLSGLGKGTAMEKIRKWLKAGFLLAEIGHGIIETWLALEEADRSKNLSGRDRLKRLRKAIDIAMWHSEQDWDSAPEAKPEAKPETGINTPAGVIDRHVSKPASTKKRQLPSMLG